MSEQDIEQREREEIEMLLPWYATGRLDRAGHARVESYLARHPHVATQLDLIREEREQTVSANEAVSVPSAAALVRLMASLPSARPSLSQRIAGSSVVRQLAELFTAPTAGGGRWAALAAAALILVQAAVIATLLVQDRGGNYQSASGQSDNEGISALVAFSDEAKAGAVAQLLAEFQASVVDGPRPGGVYKIRLRKVAPADRDTVLRRLAERRDVVKMVLPSRN